MAKIRRPIGWSQKNISRTRNPMWLSATSPVRTFATTFSDASCSERDPPREDIAPHDPVAHERVERIRERSRPILLEEEVSDPREHVSCDQACEHPPQLRRHDCGHQTDETDRGAGEVQPPARPVRML